MNTTYMLWVSGWWILSMAVAIATGFACCYFWGREDGRKREIYKSAVKRTIDSLPGQQSSMVYMHSNQNLTYVQIARVLGLSPEVVLSEMTKAYSTIFNKHNKGLGPTSVWLAVRSGCSALYDMAKTACIVNFTYRKKNGRTNS